MLPPELAEVDVFPDSEDNVSKIYASESPAKGRRIKHETAAEIIAH